MATRRRMSQQPNQSQATADSASSPVPPSIPIEYTSRRSYPDGVPPEGSDWVSGIRLRVIRVTLPQQTLSPVEFHSFSLPEFSAEFEVPENIAADVAIERCIAALRKAQQAAFEPELTRYLENVMNAGNIAFQVQVGNQVPRSRQQ